MVADSTGRKKIAIANCQTECVSLSIGDQTRWAAHSLLHMPPLLCLIFPRFLKHVWHLSKRPLVKENVCFVRYVPEQAKLIK